MKQSPFDEFRAENHWFKATTLATANQKIHVQQAGLTCKAMPVIFYCTARVVLRSLWNNSPRRFSAGVLKENGLKDIPPIGSTFVAPA
jgi:hypothetical protein